MLNDEKTNGIVCIFCNLKFSKDSKQHINYGKWNLYSVSEYYSSTCEDIFCVLY